VLAPSHHIANRTAKNGYRHIWLRAHPRFARLSGLDRKPTVVGKLRLNMKKKLKFNALLLIMMAGLYSCLN